MSTVELNCYLIVKAKVVEGRSYVDGKPTVRVSKNKPRTEANEVAIKINLELPIGLFKRPQIVANISVPPDTSPTTITAEVQDNIANAIRESSGMDVRIVVESAAGVQ